METIQITSYDKLLRKGKAGLKKYLISRLQHVKDIFRREKENKEQETYKDPSTDPPDGHQAIPMPADPPPLPELPEPIPATEEHEVLQVGTAPVTPKTTKNQYGKETVRWINSGMKKVRKVMEICTWTMLLTTIALEKDPNWRACTPVSIEHGFDVLTVQGRKRAEQYIYQEKPDLLIGEWMCGPFSSLQHINKSKSPELCNKIVREQREHAKLAAWIAKIEKWQTQENKGLWVGEQPHKCGSWDLPA